MEECIHYKSSNFHKFVEICRFIIIFGSDREENSYQLQNMLKNIQFYTMCINHNEEQYGK